MLLKGGNKLALIIALGLVLTNVSTAEIQTSAAPAIGGPLERSEGGSDRGGGDPDVSVFMSYSLRMARWIRNNEIPVEATTAVKFVDKVQELDAQLNDPGRPSPIEFVDRPPNRPLVDQFGKNKIALFDQATNTILVSRRAWKSPQTTLEDRYVTTAIEIMGLIGEKRYKNSIFFREHVRRLLAQGQESDLSSISMKIKKTAQLLGAAIRKDELALNLYKKLRSEAEEVCSERKGRIDSGNASFGFCDPTSPELNCELQAVFICEFKEKL